MSRLSLIEKAFCLKKTPLFQELDLDLLLAIADKADERRYAKDEIIFSNNQDAHRLYILTSGKVAIINANQTHISTLEAQDYFGDEALFAQASRAYSVIALVASQVLTVSRTHLVQIMLESPNIALTLIRAFASTTPFRMRKQEDQA
jgi:CRP/FNR family transcriptional regulator, cyclic AMP receptor protein